MKSTLLTVLVVLSSTRSEKRPNRATSLYSLQLSTVGLSSYGNINFPLEQSQYYAATLKDIAVPQGQAFHIPQVGKDNIAPVAYTNSVEKPVEEVQDYVPPPQSSGPAIIPFQPPPAVPVNAAAANVPANNGAVFLGSGSLGVINLGNGAFALGSGGIGYSDIRQQPRPSGTSPLYPPLPANPNLVPAAKPSQTPTPIPQGTPISQLTPNGFHFSQPVFVQAQQPSVDQNGYEQLTTNSAGFGSPSPRIRPLKTTNNYATPTATQVQIQPIHPSQRPQPGFGEPVPRLPAVGLQYFNYNG
ncbi:uncharacterized protein LOC132704668 [Cylas formicarius]|uniref:uncharacterized protein LOC132704668 n=1 Tax=Cylas formicarius TaxID=197179 RepID=UPI002958A0EC|nr:uncharacterized protein LOC132704668 [Cylas formicarius]